MAWTRCVWLTAALVSCRYVHEIVECVWLTAALATHRLAEEKGLIGVVNLEGGGPVARQAGGGAAEASEAAATTEARPRTGGGGLPVDISELQARLGLLEEQQLEGEALVVEPAPSFAEQRAEFYRREGGGCTAALPTLAKEQTGGSAGVP